MTEKEELLNNPLVKELFENWNRGRIFSYTYDGFEEDYAKFVQSQLPKKDWEIVSLLSDMINNDENTFPSNFEDAVRCGRAKIHSVRRKSDNEVFTIGDMVSASTMKEKINSFRLSGTGMIYFNDNILLWGWRKVKKSLFVTEDGKDVFEGDNMYLVSTTMWTMCEVAACKNPFKGFAGIEFLYLSSREKAQEYIRLNKPSLSLSEILKTKSVNWNSPLGRELEKELVEIAKNK